MPNYYTNSVFGPNISQFDANGPFWPEIYLFIYLKKKREKKKGSEK